MGRLDADVLLGDVRSLKQKRSVVRPVLAALRARDDVAAAETGDQDLHRRAALAVVTVAGEPGRCREVLDGCERLLAARPELELLSVRVRLHGPEDEGERVGAPGVPGTTQEGERR